MRLMDSDRRIPFEGNDADYIYFLEERIFKLESIVNANIHGNTRLNGNHDAEGARNSCQAIYTPLSMGFRDRQTDVEPDSGIRRKSRGEKRLSSAGRRAGEDLGNLEIIEYQPAVATKPSSNKRKRGNESKTAKDQRRLLLDFTSFIQNLPQSRAWRDWTSVSDIQRARLLRGLLHGFAPPDDIRASHSQTDSPTQISILQEYGNSMRASCTTIRQLTCFRELIFCSLCAVAVRSAVNKDEVYETMRTIFRSDAYSKRFEGLIRGAKWVNNAISLLSQTKWALRSYEIFLVAGHRMGFYAKLNDFSIKPEHLVHSLETESINSSYPQINIKTSISLAIPLIVKEIYKDCTSLTDICECLGYTRSSIETNCTSLGIIPLSSTSTEETPRDICREVPNSLMLENHHTQLHGSDLFRSRQDQDMNGNTDPQPSDCSGRNIEDSNHRHRRIVNQNEDPPPLPPPPPPQPEIFPLPNDTCRSFGASPGFSGSLDSLNGLSQSEPCDLLPTGENSGGNNPGVDDSGVDSTWFSTYLDPSLDGTLGEENVVMSDAWFSTFPNPQLGESMAQEGDLGISYAWFSTYQNG